MIRSQPIDIDGRFVGVAVQSSHRWHFVAVEPVLSDLDGAGFDTAEDAARIARAVLRRARQPSPAAPLPPPPARLRPVS
ncbi:hypothetical protein JYK14_16605 [Siccirubricoccus sp. KC 17139]|uniref:Uncharacterized protein n=1 Tax=Siccirubricoccus soli TaxID=2899147 RepID=A0ABT1D758_9PROT|nr:hypothetical protein [Siccirubricoccus soli]MCO6417770.1 hypothetical protein [Siccirubricoccus soli]MCP2683905.1 hypothetical protein [Siccirubricoccus soli]